MSKAVVLYRTGAERRALQSKIKLHLLLIFFALSYTLPTWPTPSTTGQPYHLNLTKTTVLPGFRQCTLTDATRLHYIWYISRPKLHRDVITQSISLPTSRTQNCLLSGGPTIPFSTSIINIVGIHVTVKTLQWTWPVGNTVRRFMICSQSVRSTRWRGMVMDTVLIMNIFEY